MIDQSLIDKLVCPITRSKLRKEGEFLVSQVGGIKYPIRDGLPVLLPDAAILPLGVTLEELKAKRSEAAK